jgi:hypothetical protein
MQKPSDSGDAKTNQALQFYANHTAQIEVMTGRFVISIARLGYIPVRVYFGWLAGMRADRAT